MLALADSARDRRDVMTMEGLKVDGVDWMMGMKIWPIQRLCRMSWSGRDVVVVVLAVVLAVILGL